LGGLTGITPYKAKVVRRLSDLRASFLDTNLVEKMLLKGENPMIYEVYEIPQQPVEGVFNVGCTVLYPGKIGNEYFFTKGHFHQKDFATEVYIGMEGQGIILMEDRKGKASHLEIKPNVLVYIPPATAHRSINTGKDQMVFLAIYPSDAGHDYGTIDNKGFAKTVVEKNGKPTVTENPRYSR